MEVKFLAIDADGREFGFGETLEEAANNLIDSNGGNLSGIRFFEVRPMKVELMEVTEG